MESDLEEPENPPDPEPQLSEPARKSRPSIWQTLGSICFVGLLLAVVSMFITLPYYVLSPGDGIPVKQFVSVPADKAFPPQGSVLMTTVGVAPAHPFGIVWAWLTPGTRIEPKKNILGTASQKQYDDFNRESMDDSKMTAIYVAMKRAGYDVKQTGDGAEIGSVATDAPANGHLKPGDVVTAVNGKGVLIATDLTGVTRTLKPGDVVHLDVLDAQGAKRTEDIVGAPRPPELGGAGVYLGLSIQTKNPRLDTPFNVELTTTQIGGPSAGLAFTLELLDELTKGELTGGQKIAVTGTISPDGSVGPVGGVEQKTHAVRAAGAKLFIVPSDEYDVAKKNAGNKLKVVKADTLDQALNALRDNGGDVSGVPAGAAMQPAA